MKGNFVRTIIKSLLCLALLMALIGTANAGGPPTNLIGSWQCEVDGDVVFLVNFELGGTLTAIDPDNKAYYGAWKRTGLNTFESTDKSFDITYQCLVETYTINTMLNNDTISAEAKIKECDGNITEPPTLTCTRIQITPLP
ncbi:MAG: hypothetical protein JRD93_21785 [Deltaproteobacteria bacterium]|nr:hypothetical protein [Deltaproteobacteria bacterium]